VKKAKGFMTDRLTIDAQAKDAYWKVVTDCLIKFHGKSGQDAQNLTCDYRRKVEDPGDEPVGDIIYHEEPFYVACDLAKYWDLKDQDRLLQQHGSAYEKILSDDGWV
jgi:hypothetical protein